MSVGYGFSTIQIDTKYWNQISSLDQMFLLYHELGHCVLGEGHISDPTAIMNPVINNTENNYYPSNLTEMLNQLFLNKGYKGNTP